MKPKKLVISLICLLLSVWMFAALPVGAIGSGYYNDYSSIKNSNGNLIIGDTEVNGVTCGSMQGMAVGSTYIYTAKIDKNATTCILRKTKISDGSTSILTFSGKKYTTVLYHANDMDVCGIDGYSTLFVATMRQDGYSLAKIKVSGTTATITGHWTIKCGTEILKISGVAVYSNDKTNKKTTLLLKSGKNFYKVTIPWSSTSGTYTVTQAFSVNNTSIKVNGTTVNTGSGWLTQGIAYHGGYVFYPITKNEDNVSIVAVYKVPSTNTEVTSSSTLSFRITSSTYSDLFEIESVGIGSDGKLYFNTNRRKTAKDAKHDGIHWFKNSSGDYVSDR